MRVKPTNPANAVGLIDPQTMRSPFIDPETGEVLDSAVVPDNTFWTRRLLHGELELVAETATPTTTPTGREPIAPLTTRSQG